MLSLWSYTLICTVIKGYTFDDITTEIWDTSTGVTETIGWIKILSCNEGLNPTFIESISDYSSLITSAYTFRIIPPGNHKSNPLYNELAVIAKPGSDAMNKLNNGFVPETELSDIASNWIGSTEALNRLAITNTASIGLGGEFGEYNSNGFMAYYWSFGNSVGIAIGQRNDISEGYCYWEYPTLKGQDIEIYFGYQLTASNDAVSDPSQCLNTGRSIQAWYAADDLFYWFGYYYIVDKSGNSNWGTITNPSNEISINTFPNGRSYLTGTTSTSILFDVDLHPTDHTVLSVTKYNGDTRGRILQTSIDNGVFGHWMGKSGQAYEHLDFITDSTYDAFGDAWVVSSQQKSLYRGNFRDLTENPSNAGFSASDPYNNLAINMGWSVNIGGAVDEKSDYAISELIVFNELLSLSEIYCIEFYLINKYFNEYNTQTPTASPSLSPTTTAPSPSPTGSPSAAPSQSPTVPPSTAPTSPPTTCYDLDGVYTNDGYEESINDILSSLTLTNMRHLHNMSDHAKIITIKKAQFTSERIILSDDSQQLLHCSLSGSCNGADIIFTRNSICYIICDNFLSCATANVDILECAETEIICNGHHACDGMTVHIESFNKYKLNIFCGQNTSCDDMEVNIIGNIESNISCIDINACDSLRVNIGSDYYQTNFLHMYSYSNNITFSNGQGYRPSTLNITNSTTTNDTTPFITCNTKNQYIEWDSSMNISDPLFKQEILSEYINHQFPCSDVTVECARELNDTSNCEIDFDITKVPTITNPIESACYWVPVADIIDIRCNGDCQSSPTRDPTQAPTKTPTQTTINPTKYPSQEPTVDPTMYPSQPPTLAPSVSPSTPLTSAPSQPPTNVPTTSPSKSPTDVPSQPPTSAPSLSPSQAPSTSPTPSPSNSPSQPPSAAPSRLPTQDVDKIYDTKIDISYYCYNLTRSNKEYIVYNTKLFITKFQEIIERYYFDPDNGLYFGDFWVQVVLINGKSVVFTDQRRLISEDSNVLTLYDLDILGNSPLILAAKIECDDDNGEIIIKKSESAIFRASVERELAAVLFNNTQEIYFKVEPVDGDELYEEEKFPAPPAEESEDLLDIWLSIVIVSIGGIISLAVFVHNKRKSTKVDNANAAAPLLIALAIYDFYSDINLAIQIFRNEDLIVDMTNIYFLLGIFSVLSIAIPFILNLWYARKIQSQETIQNSPSARAWFANHFGLFILMCIFSAGTYPALGLVSSRIFGLDLLNTGLLSSELHELSKIKIRSTIYGENVPQLIIQVVYSYASNQLENATILAFIASSLSIIASLLIYYAQKEQKEKFITIKYFLKLEANQKIDVESQAKIKFNKGLKEKLRDSLCQVFQIPNKSIEIGYVQQNDSGCRIHIQQSIFKNDMQKIKKQMLERDYNFTTRGYVIEITEDMYIKQVVKDKRKELKDAILNHFFGLDIDNIELKYELIYQSGDEIDNEILKTPRAKRMKLPSGKQMRVKPIAYQASMDDSLSNEAEEQKLIEMVEIEDDIGSTQLRCEGIGDKYEMQSLMKTVNEMKNEFVELKTFIISGEKDNIHNLEVSAPVNGEFVETQLSTQL